MPLSRPSLRRGVLITAVASSILVTAVAVAAGPVGPPAARTGAAWVDPTQTVVPAGTSPTVPGGQPTVPGELRLVAAGDVLVHPALTDQARRDARRAGRPGLDFAPMFAGVAPAIGGADLALCHLETPLAPPDGPFAGYPAFSAPPQVLDGIQAAGFDGCSTASNHTLDQGVDGVVRTLDALDASGLGYTGSARSAAEAETPRIYEVAGARVAHLSYTQNFNGLRRPPGKRWLANLIDPAEVLSAARRARTAGADIVVLSLHWGTEYQHRPDTTQESWARQLIASPDVDLILGHHAHAVQPFRRVGEKWVVFGMGNQLARHATPIDANREGIMARATFTRDGSGRWRVSRMEALPTWTELRPDIRLVDLAEALADPATPPATRRAYRATYERVMGHVRAGGGADQVVGPAA
ncbi:CapA family protein [Micromonospora sp. WMMA1363]|uniref:CapA family protein n=1 Tax=Micromonospora sp. WMMA1363 TaxID=3053985 RepID=UPI00259CD811|nr:CapA family protein [Micromonospora sp. WMMA1363]MDM4722153.1 CapA family protein [Micromonospora sp. WMMA1363]